jgi:hypothetical protein
MPELQEKTNVIILCDSWYTKGDLVSVVDECPNLGLIGNARHDSVLYDLAPQRTGKRGRPAKHGKRLSAEKDFTLSDEKIGGYYIGTRRVLTNIFGTREVFAYVTATEKEGGSRRLFFSTAFPTHLQIFCAWQEKAPLNQTGSAWMDCIPLFLYSFRWNIEVRRIFTIFKHPLMNDCIIPFIFHGKYTAMHKLFILQKTMYKIFRFPCLFINSGQTLCIVIVCNCTLFVKIIYRYPIEPC